MVYELELLVRIIIASMLGAAIGFDREWGHKPAGLRTHMLVGLGSAMFVVLGELLLGYFSYETDSMRYDPTRILEAVVGGVAFLGAGTIFFSRGENIVKGITTAASLWATAGVGMATGLEHYVLAVGTTLLIVVILQLFRLLEHDP
ncbi:MAG: MgtC/SapB family protein [Pseudohongiellaceae bacterium]